MKNKDKAKMLLGLVATMLLTSSYDLPEEETVHSITKIEKTSIEQVIDNDLDTVVINIPTIEPESIPTATPEPPVPATSNLDIDYNSLTMPEIYELGDDAINYYYDTYGYDKAISYICDRYNITYDEFKIVSAIIMAEGNRTYEEAYCVTNTIYNRINSISSINYVNAVFGMNVGKSLFYQSVCPDQFVVYQNGRYYEFYNVLSGSVFRGIIDMLISEIPRHNYLQFLANETNAQGEIFTDRGNKYFTVLQENDRLVEKSTLQMK